MQRSAERILTTHVGSLPRPTALLEMLHRIEEGAEGERSSFQARCREAVAEVVRVQRHHGIDVVSDGEMSKASFISYVQDRLAGFEMRVGGTGVEGAGGAGRLASRETLSFPEFYEAMARQNGSGKTLGLTQMECVGPVTYKGHAQLQVDIDNLRSAMKASGSVEGFLPAIAPSDIEGRYKNRYYRSNEEYLFAIAEAMREEYRAIVDAGLLVQIDDPLLLTYYVKHPDRSVEQCRAWAAVRVEALNHAIRGIPPEKMRFHTCYGINMGPRIHDMELRDVIDLLMKINAGAYSFEAANPRHEHEWRVWRDVKLPDEKILIPGIISHTTHLVEHPEAIADRIARYADVVGRERVIAGADCGFATFASSTEIHPSIVWAKFDALSKGAGIASARLWGVRAKASKRG